MYYVYLDNELIHDLSTGLILQSPTMELAENSAGSFTFGVVDENPAYTKVKDKITKGIVKVMWDEEVIFEGRIMDVSQDFFRTCQVRCEGLLAYLADSIQRATKYEKLTIRQYLEKLLAVHNSQTDPEKQIALGKVEVTDRMGSRDYVTDYRSTWDTISSDLVGKHGGILQLVRNDKGALVLNYLTEYPNTCTQAIEFADNLLNYAENLTASSLATRCIPLGEKLESDDQTITLYTTIADVNGGKDYVEIPDAVKRYGIITKTVTYDGVKDKNMLMQLGTEWLKAWQYSMLTLTLTAADLADYGLEKDHLRLLSKVRCLSEPHGMDVWLPITEVVVCLTDPTRNIYTIGNKPMALSEKLLRESDDLKASLAGKTDAADAADIAQKYDKVVIDKNRQEVTEALLVANNFTTEQLKGYLTAVETKTEIKTSAQAINLSITQQGNVLRSEMDNKLLPYATKTALDLKAKSITASVKEQLGDYYLKSEVDLKVDGLTSTVKSKLSASEMWTKITQDATKLKIAWNGISDTVTLENAALCIYESSSRKKLSLDKTGIHIYQDGVVMASIGQKAMVSVPDMSYNNSSGAVLVGEKDANYVGLGGVMAGDSNTYLRFFYASKKFGGFIANCLHAGCSLHMHTGNIYQARLVGTSEVKKDSYVQYCKVNKCDMDYSDISHSTISSSTISGTTINGCTLKNCTIDKSNSIPSSGSSGGTTIVQGLQGTGFNGQAGINYYLLTGWSYRKNDSRGDYMDAHKIIGYQKVQIVNGLLKAVGGPQGTSN